MMRVFYLFYVFTDLFIWITAMFMLPVMLFSGVLPGEIRKCEEEKMEPCSTRTMPMVMQVLMVVAGLMVGSVFHVYTSRIIYTHYHNALSDAAGVPRPNIMDAQSNGDKLPTQPRRQSLLKSNDAEISTPEPVLMNESKSPV